MQLDRDRVVAPLTTSALFTFARFRANFSTFISRLNFQAALTVGTRT
jgi:hypothetical protein